jgi:O-antigen/teichoic acid export membrane protein
MNRLRKVIGHTVISLLGQAVTWASTIILLSAYGRFLGDVKLGELYLAISFVALVGFPIEAGFNQQLTRDVAQDSSKALRYITDILCFKVILWVILYGCILLLSQLLGYSSEVRTLVVICGITLLITSIANVMSASHYAFERVTFPVIGNILEKGLGAVIGAILLHHGSGVETMALVLLGCSCVNMLWQTAWVLRLVGIPCTFDIPLARMLLRKSIPFILYGVLGVIYYRIDTILLSFMASTAAVGWYGAAYRIFDTLVFLPSLVISAIMYPVFSKLSAYSQKELKLAVEKSLNFLLFCCIPISTGLIVAAPNVIGFLYHRAEFDNAIPVMQCLAFGLLFLYINSVLSSVMISTGREKKIPIMAGIALVFNLGLNWLLIPLYQQVGAALVTSLTELLLTILALLFVPRPLWPTGSLKVALKALLAALVMGLAVWFIQRVNLVPIPQSGLPALVMRRVVGFMHEYSLLAILPVAAVVYLGTATLIGTIPREDMSALYASVRHKAKRGKTGSEQGMAGEDVSFLTEEEMEQEQEFLFVLGREMTNPVLPAFKYEMTQPLFPAYRDEMTQPLLRTYRDGEITARLPDISLLSTIEDQDATVLRKAVRPTKNRKIKDFSSSKVEENNEGTVLGSSYDKEQKNMKTLY